MIGPLTLAAHNRRIAAARVGWPTGVLEVCERLDAEHPPWSASWAAENTIKGWERPAGYCARRYDISLPRADRLRRLPEDNVPRYPAVFGEDVAELVERIERMDERIAAELERQERMSRWMMPRLG